MSTEQPIRIASLLPAATEIVCALGFQDNLVGLSHECDYPNDLATLPVCTKALISPDGTSLEIDAAVKNALKNALSIYHVEDNALRIAKPDVIITQDQCEVCAVAIKDVEAAVCDLLESDAQIVSLNPEGIENVYKDIERIADALNAHAKGKELTQAMQQRFDDLRYATDGNSFFNRPGPRIVESAEILTEIFFPDMGASQHHGTRWVKVSQL